MKKGVLSLLISISYLISYAQGSNSPDTTATLQHIENTDTSPKPISQDVIYSVVEELAEFPGGNEKMDEYLKANINNKEGIEAKFFVQMIITEKGKITNVKLLKASVPSGELTDQVLKVVSEMPDWKPAKLGQCAVKSRRSILVRIGKKE